MYFYYIFLNNRQIDSIVLHTMCVDKYLKNELNKYLIRGAEVKQPRAKCVSCKKILDEKAATKYLKDRLDNKPLRELNGMKIMTCGKKYSLFCGEEPLLDDVGFEEIKDYLYENLIPSSKIQKAFDELLFNKLFNSKRKQ